LSKKAVLKIKIANEQKNNYTRSLLQIQKTSGIAASGHVREYGMFSKIECEWSSRGSGFVGKCAMWRNVSKICVWIKGVRAKQNTESKPKREEQREKNKERRAKREEQREKNKERRTKREALREKNKERCTKRGEQREMN
jgi:hypothetical protein